MRALFVHGMGRTPLSGSPLLWRLRTQGVQPSVFGYCTALESFSAISARLSKRLQQLGQHDDYVLIGHSLGGVLLRDALAHLPDGTRMPRHLFLLGSPMTASRLAQRWRSNCLFRLLAGDAGQVLANAKRMAAIPAPTLRTTHIIGTRGTRLTAAQFVNTENDGVVAVREVRGLPEHAEIQIPVMHTWLPSSRRVSTEILARMFRAT